MRASVHLVDGGVGAGLRLSRRQPTPTETPGLVEARMVVAAPLSASAVPRPQLSRAGLVAFWEDDDAIDRFERHQPLAKVFAEGWSARLEPRRAVPVAAGHFPGVPDDVPGPDAADHEGPAAVLTIGRLRRRRTVPFLRTSARAEAQIAGSPGLLWATGLTNVAQGIVATFSLWETAAAPHGYATTTSGHTAALRSERQRSFHHAGSFIRFRPYAVAGHLPGRRNPLTTAVTASLNGTRTDER